MSVAFEAPRGASPETALARVRAEVRCGDVVGRVWPHPRGVCVVPDPFFGGVMPEPTSVVEVEWRSGPQRYVALAPVLMSTHGPAGVVLGGFRHCHVAGAVRERDWRMLFVDQKGEELVSDVHRVRFADDDFVRVTAPPDTRPRRNELWTGRVRVGTEELALRLQVRGVHVWGADGTRVIALRWLALDPARWTDDRGGRHAR